VFVSCLVIVLSSEAHNYGHGIIHSMPLDNEPRFPFLFDHVLVQTLAWQTSILACKNNVKCERNKISPTGISARGCFSRRSSLSWMLPCNFSILSKRFSMENHFFQSQTSQTKLTLPGNFHSGFVLAFMSVQPGWHLFLQRTVHVFELGMSCLESLKPCEQRTFSYFLCYSIKVPTELKDAKGI